MDNKILAIVNAPMRADELRYLFQQLFSYYTYKKVRLLSWIHILLKIRYSHILSRAIELAKFT